MRFISSVSIVTVTLFASLLFSSDANAQLLPQLNSSTGYYPFVIALPQDRQRIRNTPIEQRPARPLHFYGNIVRQSYTVRPTERSLLTTRPGGISSRRR
jgi:hypothetical protein